MQNDHRGAIIWFNGLSDAGQSTLAHAVEEQLHQQGCRTFVLDGDNVRHGLCGDHGFQVLLPQQSISPQRSLLEKEELLVTSFPLRCRLKIGIAQNDHPCYPCQQIKQAWPHQGEG